MGTTERLLKGLVMSTPAISAKQPIAKRSNLRIWKIVLFVLVALISSQRVLAEWHYEEHYIFGTSVSIQLWADDLSEGKRAMEAVVSELWRIHNALSPLIESTELAQLNQNGYPGPVIVSDELAQLIDKSLFFGSISEGAFDISFASLGYLYDYREGKKPTEAEIARLKTSIDYTQIQYSPEAREVQFLDPLIKIDLGGIAKGYAVERIAELLPSLGVFNATISAGGDSRVIGDKRGQPWIVGIRNPRSEESAIRLPLEDFAISTSGDYERFFIDAETGERVHHIINPSTGKSATDIASVSVIGPSGFDTDPLSTTLFVLGREKGLSLIEQFENYDAIFIDHQGKVHFSSGLTPPE